MRSTFFRSSRAYVSIPTSTNGRGLGRDLLRPAHRIRVGDSIRTSTESIPIRLPANPVLRADKDGKEPSSLDRKTTLTGIPDSAWQYRLGSRSRPRMGPRPVHRERKPRDPTIRERFNTYRFADHKERVIDLLQRVCTVSVETVRIVNQLAELSNIPTHPRPAIESAHGYGVTIRSI